MDLGLCEEAPYHKTFTCTAVVLMEQCNRKYLKRYFQQMITSSHAGDQVQILTFYSLFQTVSETVRTHLQNKAGCLTVPHYYRLLPIFSIFLQSKSEESFPMSKSH